MPTVYTIARTAGTVPDLLAVTATVVDGPPALTLTGESWHHKREMRDRVRAALANAGHPTRDPVEVSLDPQTVRPPEAAAVAVAVLAAATGTGIPQLEGTVVLGEVGLDGSLRPATDVLAAATAAAAHGARRVIVPAADLDLVALVGGIEVAAATSLADIGRWLRGDEAALTRSDLPDRTTSDRHRPVRELAAPVLRAVTVAAAGGHHVLSVGGAAADTLQAALWLHGLLPDLTPPQQLEVAELASQADTGEVCEDGKGTGSAPPWVFAHRCDSNARLIGGTVPGAVTHTHHGMLFTGDLDRFTFAAQEALRSVLLSREVLIDHGGRLSRHPAGFQLVASGHRRPWLSLALLDVIDIRLTPDVDSPMAVPPPHAGEQARVAELLEETRAQVAAARARAAARWSAAASATAGMTFINAAVPAELLHAVPIPAEVVSLIEQDQQRGGLSRRGGDIVLRLAWTIADLEGADTPGYRHAQEAVALRRPARAAGS